MSQIAGQVVGAYEQGDAGCAAWHRVAERIHQDDQIIGVARELDLHAAAAPGDPLRDLGGPPRWMYVRNGPVAPEHLLGLGDGQIRRMGYRTPPRLDDQDRVAEGVILTGVRELGGQVHPLRFAYARSGPQAWRESAVDDAGHMEEADVAVLMAQGGPPLADEAVPCSHQSCEFRLDGEWGENKGAASVSGQSYGRQQVKAAGAQELRQRPQNGSFGASDRVSSGRGKDPASPLAAEEVNLGNAPAFIDEPESVAVLVEFQPGVSLRHATCGTGQVLEYVLGVIRAYQASCCRDTFGQIADQEGAQQVPGVRIQLMSGRGDSDGQTVQTQLQRWLLNVSHVLAWI